MRPAGPAPEHSLDPASPETLPHPARSEDLWEAFLSRENLTRKLGKVHGPDQVRPWLVSVAVTQDKQLLRKRRRRAELEIAVDASAEAGGIDPATGVGSVDLRAALRRLDPDERALLAMRYGAGFNSSELAIATGTSSAAIRQRLKRLVDHLREDLSHD